MKTELEFERKLLSNFSIPNSHISNCPHPPNSHHFPLDILFQSFTAKSISRVTSNKKKNWQRREWLVVTINQSKTKHNPGISTLPTESYTKKNTLTYVAVRSFITSCTDTFTVDTSSSIEAVWFAGSCNKNKSSIFIVQSQAKSRQVV